MVGLSNETTHPMTPEQTESNRDKALTHEIEEDVTQILTALEAGDPSRASELLPLVYEELRRLARSRLAHEIPGQTLQPTALVHEAYLRLLGNSGEERSWSSRGHFFGAAAEAMRRILIDNARRKKAVKRGSGVQPVNLDGIELAIDMDDDVLLVVDEALTRLAEHDPEGAELVKLRFFAGLKNVEAARLLGISERTAKRTWAYARAWLYAEIKGDLGL